MVENATLTIEPCALVLLDDSISLDVTGTGKMVGRRPATQPSVFDASDPAEPWIGLVVGYGEPVGGFLDLA